MELTQDKLHELLEYSPHTGKLTWRRRKREMFKTEWSWKTWNRKHAGKQAGCICPNRYGHLRSQVGIGNKRYAASHLIWLWMTGKKPTGYLTYADDNPVNLAWSNLQERS